MRNRKLLVQILCAFLALLMIMSLLSAVIRTRAQAASSSEIQAEIDELNTQKSEIQAQINAVQTEIDSLDFQKANVLEKKLILDQKNTLAQQELDVIQEQIDIIDGLVTNMQSDLAAAQTEEDNQRTLWLTRVRAMEEDSALNYMQVIFNATSFSDLLTRIDLVKEVMEYDTQLEADYTAARENVETLESQAETLYSENAANKAELETKKAQLEADIESACQLIAEMETNIDEYEAVILSEQETQAEVEALIVEKEAELAEAKAAEEAARQAAAAAAAAAAQSGGSPVSFGGGAGAWMMWPSYTSYITSYYGYRYLELYGYTRLHAGVDVGAAYGTAVWAAAGGTVIQAGWNGGYGNCVMINHGNGYTTLYGHMSQIYVSSGQTVSMGDTIGLVGSTGNSTGPHLHFEVRSSSTGGTMNPLSFSYY